MSTHHARFLHQLSQQYGEWRKESSLFGSRTYGDIAELLCISPSQFSKLISGTATDGMYLRSLRNLKQLEELAALKAEKNKFESKDASGNSQAPLHQSNRKQYWSRLLVIAAIPLLCLLAYQLGKQEKGKRLEVEKVANDGHALSKFFDQNFRSPHVSPYLNTSEALDYCPCSAYEGKWELEKQYIIPIPAKKPGLFYVARSSDLRLKCLRSQSKGRLGYSLAGFEQMAHELWIDTENEPLSPRYFNLETKTFTKDFYNLAVENQANFKKVATISSFMYNRFELENGQIYRTAEPVGRFAEDVDQNLANSFEIDVKHILENVIGNMVKTNCQPTQNDHCNPNTLIEGESVFRFMCDFTIATENLGFGGSYPYTKGFRLLEQNYSDNLLCTCND